MSPRADREADLNHRIVKRSRNAKSTFFVPGLRVILQPSAGRHVFPREMSDVSERVLATRAMCIKGVAKS